MPVPPYTHALCIDPGASGAASLARLSDGEPELLHNFYGARKSAEFIERCVDLHPVLGVVIENVHATPVMAVSSAFSFGSNFGMWLGILASWDLPVHGVTPQEWQKWLTVPTELQGPDRKRHLKEKAANLFPRQKVTLTNCDALLLGFRTHSLWNCESRLPGKLLDL